MSNACDVEATQTTQDLGSVLRRIVDQIDDAERSNADTLQEMQERLTSLSEQTQEARNGDSAIDEEALEKIETQIAGLSDRIEIISEGRSINADNLEGRIEALAEQLTDEDDGEDTTEAGEVVSSDSVSDVPEPPAAVSAAPSSPSEKEGLMDERADITFVVTDDMNTAAEEGASASDEIIGEALAAAYGSSSDAAPDPDVVEELSQAHESYEAAEGADSAYSHKITATVYETQGPIEPNRLASLAQHFSPAQAEQEALAKGLTSQLKQDADPDPKGAISQDVLEERFAIIASKLEQALDARAEELQERVDISNKFDELAIRFEGWLRAKDNSSGFQTIEQKIGDLTEHVRNAETHAARIDNLEKQLHKLIDLVENGGGATASGLPEDFDKIFESVATRILDEKTSSIADLVASQVGSQLEKHAGLERIGQVQQSLSDFSSEHRLSDAAQSSRLNSVDSNLNTISGRLVALEEHIMQEPVQFVPMEPSIPIEQIESGAQTLAVEPEKEAEESSFHQELELSVHEVIDENQDNVPEVRTAADQAHREVHHQEESHTPMVLSQEADEQRSDVKFAPSASVEGNEDDYVETARRAAKQAYEKKQEARQSHSEEHASVRNLIHSYQGKKWRLSEVGQSIRRFLKSLSRFGSTSILVLGASALLVICFGILYKELSGVSKMRRDQLEASKPVRWDERENIITSKSGSKVARTYQREGHTNNQLRTPTQSLGQPHGGASHPAGSFLDSARIAEEVPEDSHGVRIRSFRSLPSAISNKRNSQELQKQRGGEQKRNPQQEPFAKRNRIPISAPERQRNDMQRFPEIVTSGRRVSREQNVNSRRGNVVTPDFNVSGLPVLNQQKRATDNKVEHAVGNRPQYIKKRMQPVETDRNFKLPEQVGSVSLRNAAIGGNYKAQYAVAMRYLEGKKVPRNYAAAARWLRRSASQSFAPAKLELAVLYERGRGVSRDLGKARSWYERAARRGNIRAMHNLAVLLTTQSGNRSNHMQAIEWFSRAANYGYRDSQYNLGILYKSGMGVEENKVEAYKWFALASQQGDTLAEKQLSKLKFNMSQDNIMQAEAALASWAKMVPNKSSNLTAKEVSAFTGNIMTPYADILVYEAQVLLNKLGYNVGTADGQYGPKTRDAVKNFQKRNAIEPSGVVTPKLITVLRRQVS